MSHRMARHMREARTGSGLPKHIWLASLLAQGIRPKIAKLEICDTSRSSAIERRWARRLGRRFPLLNMARVGAGNPGVGRVDWTPDIIKMLGTVPDSTLAKLLGCERKTVSYRREVLGIPASFDRTNNIPPPPNGGWNKISLSDRVIIQLGTKPDYKLAQENGVSKRTIFRARQARGIASYGEQTGNDGKIKAGEPHRRWSRPLPLFSFEEPNGATPPARPADDFAVVGR
jgi:hypothetical protein